MSNLWKSLKKPFSVLAPMEDVTDTVFRQIIADCGVPDMFFTEFVNTSGFNSEGREAVGKRFQYTDKEKPIIAQIWGLQPDFYYQTTLDVINMGFNGVDINMGCPVRDVIKKGACSALIKTPEIASELIKAAQKASNGRIPVSVKTRIGFDKVKTEEWAEFLLEQDIDALTIHGRTTKQGYGGKADWEEIAKVVKLRDDMQKDTIIIGNGDIENHGQIFEYHEKYGVDGIMVGRGVLKDPFIFNPEITINDLDLSERLELLKKHVDLFYEVYGEEKSFNLLKKFFKTYLSGFEGSREIRMKFMRCKSREDVEKVIIYEI